MNTGAKGVCPLKLINMLLGASKASGSSNIEIEKNLGFNVVGTLKDQRNGLYYEYGLSDR